MTDQKIELLTMVADKEQSRTAEFIKDDNFTEREMALMEAKFDRGDDYINQSEAALIEHEKRQKRLNDNFRNKTMPYRLNIIVAIL